MRSVVEMIERIRSNIVPRWHEARFRNARRHQARRPAELDPRPLVTLLCVSNRPEQLDHIVATWQSQARATTELVLVTNALGYAPMARTQLDDRPNVIIIETNPSVTLGAALNQGIKRSSGSVIAKIDDDDFYAPTYVNDSVELLRQTKAGVVGKKAHFVYLQAPDQTILRFPNSEHQRVGRVAGGTLVMHREVAEQVGFVDVNVGEDTTFARHAERAGWGIVSGAAAGYLQVRGVHGHTWEADADQLSRGARVIGPGKPNVYWQAS